mmetsp:Transcript_5941/g.9660  ORF Transcript_5941/g.9660 Transcript_5941/m.9660 type:complete len:327 (-) Transcript_5941:21-1001(-)
MAEGYSVHSAADHLLSKAPRLWQEMKGEFEASPDGELSDKSEVSTEELRKVAKWMQQTITKFGASASVAEEADRERALSPIADEVLRSFTAVIGTLLSLKRGAGVVLLTELRQAGETLTAALDQLGKAVGTPSMAMNAGKVLDRIKQIERTSTQNRAAVRRRVLNSLSQLRDAQKELQEALSAGGDKETSDDDEDLDFEDLDDALDDSERQIVEKLVELAAALLDTMKNVSTACIPAKEGSEDIATPAELEAITAPCDAAANAMDSLAVAVQGGLDPEAFDKGLVEMRSAVSDILASRFAGDGEALRTVLEAVQLTYSAASNDDKQ